MTLAACPSCSRHVRVEETRCPFCASGLEGAFANRPSPRIVVGRFSRSALFALGAAAAAAGTTFACSSADEPEEEMRSTPIYGAPAPDDDDDDVDAGNDAGSAQAIYGAPALVDSGADSGTDSGSN